MVRTRHLLLATLTALLVAGIASAKEPTIGSKIGSGDRADVYGGVSHPDLKNRMKVVKILRPGIWVKERFHFRDAKTLRAYGKAYVKATDALRGDSKHGEYFTKIIPSAGIDDELPGFLFVSERKGVTLDKVSSGARAAAKKEMQQAISTAKRILGQPVNEDESDFLFDQSTGEITGWTTLLPQPNGAARPYVRVKKEPLGDGYNTVAYQIKNETPGKGHLTVLKMMWPYSSQRTPVFGTEERLRGLSLDIVYSAHVLAPHLKQQMGFDVIPDSEMGDPGIVLQEMSAGVPMEKLTGNARTTATTLGNQAVSLAQSKMPKAKFSPQLTNKHFHFDPKTGRPVRGWFDWLSDSQHFWGGADRTSFRPKDWSP